MCITMCIYSNKIIYSFGVVLFFIFWKLIAGFQIYALLATIFDTDDFPIEIVNSLHIYCYLAHLKLKF